MCRLNALWVYVEKKDERDESACLLSVCVCVSECVLTVPSAESILTLRVVAVKSADDPEGEFT